MGVWAEAGKSAGGVGSEAGCRAWGRGVDRGRGWGWRRGSGVGVRVRIFSVVLRGLLSLNKAAPTTGKAPTKAMRSTPFVRISSH